MQICNIFNLINLTLVAITGAVCFGIGALCTGVAVSYYASVVLNDFYVAGGMAGTGVGNMVQQSAGSRYIYGMALFIGKD